jgi:hypothetical protein
MAKRTSPRQYLLCVSTKGYEVSLDVWKVYPQLPDEWAESHQMVRVVDNTDEDYLFPAAHFMPIKIEASIEKRIQAKARKPGSRKPSRAAAT